MRDLQAYRAIALAAIDEAAELFRTHIGAAPALFKGEGDFATEADLAIETLLRKRLTEATGIPVFGEEHGGDLNAEACWVLDPVDGTSNYSCGNPMCAILVALLIDGQPVVAVTDMPLLGHRMHAISGEPVVLDGDPLPALPQGVDPSTTAAQVGVATVGSDDRAAFPAEGRLAFVGELAATSLRPRMTGSVGVDLAFVASGVFQASVSFSPHVWDNAAGVLFGRCAGATVTDVYGQPWEMSSMGAVIGTNAAHATALATVQRCFESPDRQSASR
ncbi:inositol monophosphatase [Corynebacterium sp. NML98-0116]|uniref:inositol monophosphatase family protein n=1 Tax=Corynebacterium TaxID=1716 RepID=UPI0008790041|nr:inositol monophosphatase [Corynebacterium sp. NML98-0116]AOX05385.1 inositol monophosphatase [Corynebacterium sp. NML98-0116]MCQ4615525.1 inositol monophosphatase [Corynebacterium pseudogenitalium]